MTASEARALVAQLKAAFPRQEVTKETLAVYARMLADLDVDAAQHAVLGIMAESTFFPAIAEIRERVARNACTLPSVEAALAELDRAVRRFSPDDSRTWTYDDDWSDPLIARAVHMVGSVAQIWGSRSPGYDRREFKAAYLGLCDEQVKSVQLAIAAPANLRAIESAS
jgi:hypothetical protein